MNDQLVARNFTPLAKVAIGELQQLVSGMRRLRPACHQLATESAANNVGCRREANEAIVQLVKHCMSKLTTTMKKQPRVVAKGQPAPALRQPGVPTAQVIVPPVLLPLSPSIQWGVATADPNPAPVPQKPLSAINQPQAQGQVIPSATPGQAPLVSGIVPGQPQPQAQRQVATIALGPGQVAPAVVPGQTQPQAQEQVVPFVQAPGQVIPGIFPGQPQGKGKDSRSCHSGARASPSKCCSGSTSTASPRTTCAYRSGASRSPSRVVPGQSQPEAQGQLVLVILAQGQVAPGVAPCQPQAPINQPQAQRQVAQAGHPL